MPFAEIESVPLANKVEEQILNYIHTGKVKPGNALPSELEMAEKMSVSRSVVREALSRLKVLGLIDSRKKRGLIVTSPNAFDTLERALHPHVVEDNQAEELRELRIIIELGLAEFLFKNITEQDIEDLEVIVERENTSRHLSRQEKIDIDVDFHRRLYKTIGNNALMQFQNILISFFDLAAKFQVEEPPEVTHDILVSILKNGTPEQFHSAMKLHLKKFIDGVDVASKR
jgi:GntR family transcriptional regulator, transcriptional repressor for pyruvate dehydrogenase complex